MFWKNIKTAMLDVIEGLRYLWRGQAAFWRDRSLWVYSLPPMVVIILFYTALFFVVRFWVIPGLESLFHLDQPFPNGLVWLQETLQILLHITVWLVVFAVKLWILSNIYSLLCDLLFDALIAKFEQKSFGIQPVARSFGTVFRDIFSAVWFAVGTIVLSPVLLLLYLIPGKLVWAGVRAMILGYRFGFSYLETPAFFRGRTLSEVRNAAWHGKKWVLFGFGIPAYLLFAVPFLPLLLAPGIVLAGSLIFHNEILPLMKDKDDPREPQILPDTCDNLRLEDRCFYN